MCSKLLLLCGMKLSVGNLTTDCAKYGQDHNNGSRTFKVAGAVQLFRGLFDHILTAFLSLSARWR